MDLGGCLGRLESSLFGHLPRFLECFIVLFQLHLKVSGSAVVFFHDDEGLVGGGQLVGFVERLK